MSTTRRALVALVAAVALAIAIGNVTTRVDVGDGGHASTRLDTVPRLPSTVPAVRLRSGDSGLTPPQPALAAVEAAILAALVLVALGAVALLEQGGGGPVLRRLASGRGPPR